MQKHLVMSPRPRPSSSVIDDSNRVKAIGLMALASLCFAALDATGKYLIVEASDARADLFGLGALS